MSGLAHPVTEEEEEEEEEEDPWLNVMSIEQGKTKKHNC